MKDLIFLKHCIIILFLSSIPFHLKAQRSVLFGSIQDTLQNPVQLATVSVPEFNTGTTSDSLGRYELNLPVNINFTLIVQHIGYTSDSVTLRLAPDERRRLDVVLKQRVRVLDSISVLYQNGDVLRDQVSVYSLEPKEFEYLPTPFNDFSQVLVSLPGVSSNNELSGTYSVRGGNYDENLIYVNDIPIYRPFLIRSGEQEGLSFINPDLAGEVNFSSGGWQPEYGDALSSSLNVVYRTPRTFNGSLSLGLLGGSFHLGGSINNDKISYIIGIRHKRSEYLLNTLETEGEYYPRYSDIQSYFNFKLGDKQVGRLPKTELGVLFAFSKNRYQVFPESRETSFGTFSQPLNIYVAFLGQEILNYNTFQGAVKLTHRFHDNLTTHLILSNYFTREREYFDVEAGYRICDVDKTPGSDTFNKCISLRGIGTYFQSARNQLDAVIVNSEIRNELHINETSQIGFGIGYSYQEFDDNLQEYNFIDSADYVTITEHIAADNHTQGNVLTGYIQHHLNIRRKHMLTYGLRFNYFDINDNFLVSPRVQYSYFPSWNTDMIFRAALGMYQQQPFYREFRRFDGSLNLDLDAQKSYHSIVGMDYNFSFWGRPFKLVAEAYYKYLENVVPYDINNVRIRYYADNVAVAYAAGLDFRVSGEFVPGDESWFSIGFLSTKEDLSIDNRGIIPRPTDQLINFNIFFQDHLPKNPTYRVYLNLNYASGLPFGPPNNIEYRNVFSGESYQRIDLGLSKIFFFKNTNAFESIWLGLEVLNLTGRSNKVSYYWVRDFNNIYYGVPNALSGRFFNIKFKLKF